MARNIIKTRSRASAKTTGKAIRDSRVSEQPAEYAVPGGNGEFHARMASLFSGIGGVDLGFEFAGFRTVFQCEISKFSSAILEKHWPKVPRFPNIKELDQCNNSYFRSLDSRIPLPRRLSGANGPKSRA